MGCVRCGVGGLGRYETSFVSWRSGVRTWGKCCYICMKLEIGRFVVSYYVFVCGAIMYTINISHLYILGYNIPEYGKCSMDIK